MLRHRNRLLPLLHAASPLAAPIHPRPCCLLSTSTSKSPAPFCFEEYLVASCGLAPSQASEASKKVSRDLLSKGSGKSLEELSCSRLNSASNPDAIIALLAGAGLSRADIAAVVSADPLLLRASVEKMAPRLLGLRERLGLSAPQIVRFLLAGPHIRSHSAVVPKLEFFISFYGSFEQVLVVLRRNRRLLGASIESSVKPDIALLRQWDVPHIAHLCTNLPRLFNFNPERLKEILLRAEQLGVPPTSGFFKSALVAVVCNSKERVAAKLDFFKRTLGCSESEVSAAVSKMPVILTLSHKSLLRKIEFLVNDVAMEPRNILERPTLLTYSLEKRLVPRYYVVKILQGKGLLNSNMSISSLVSMGEETFKSKFIDCHMDFVPGLADDYAAARAGIVPSRVGV